MYILLENSIKILKLLIKDTIKKLVNFKEISFYFLINIITFI